MRPITAAIALVVIIASATLFIDPSISASDPNTALVFVGAASVIAPLEPLCLSITNAAKLLGISRSAMYLLIKNGKLRRFKVAGSRSAIEMAQLRRYIAERKADATASSTEASPPLQPTEPAE